MLAFKTFGDWDRADVILRGISSRKVSEKFKEAININAEEIRNKIVRHIDSQDLNWKPLSPRTIIQKGSDKIYIETGTLRNNIVVNKLPSSGGNYGVIVRASAHTVGNDGKTNLNKIMKYLEFGVPVNNIPPRPLINPTWREMKPKVIKDMKANFRRIILG